MAVVSPDFKKQGFLGAVFLIENITDSRTDCGFENIVFCSQKKSSLDCARLLVMDM
jgi:hypothetical protein